MTKEYRVSWEIDVDADGPHEAAKTALEIQRDPSSTALVFHVMNAYGGAVEPDVIDLMDGPAVDELATDSHGVPWPNPKPARHVRDATAAAAERLATPLGEHGHPEHEEHLICADCGECSESLNADDLCDGCAPTEGELLTREDCGCEYRQCPCESRSCPTGGVVFDFCPLHASAPAMRAALQILADTGSTEVAEIARRGIAATEPGYAPRVLVTIRGGVAEVFAEFPAGVRVVDYDIEPGGDESKGDRQIDGEYCAIQIGGLDFDEDAAGLWQTSGAMACCDGVAAHNADCPVGGHRVRQA